MIFEISVLAELYARKANQQNTFQVNKNTNKNVCYFPKTKMPLNKKGVLWTAKVL